MVGDRLIEAALSDPCSCEQLRERAAELEMARDVAQDSAVQWSKNALTTLAELHAARSLLEEARLALKPFETHYLRMVVPSEDFSYMKERIKDWFGVSDFAGAAAVLAKIEAAAKPEVKQ